MSMRHAGPRRPHPSGAFDATRRRRACRHLPRASTATAIRSCSPTPGTPAVPASSSAAGRGPSRRPVPPSPGVTDIRTATPSRTTSWPRPSAEIARVLTVPLSVDAEGGYSTDPEAIATTIATVLDAGAVGVNLEDGSSGPDLLAAKIEVARRVAIEAGPRPLHQRPDGRLSSRSRPAGGRRRRDPRARGPLSRGRLRRPVRPGRLRLRTTSARSSPAPTCR